jgi:hypothetical protein
MLDNQNRLGRLMRLSGTIRQLHAQVEECTSDYDKEKLQEQREVRPTS